MVSEMNLQGVESKFRQVKQHLRMLRYDMAFMIGEMFKTFSKRTGKAEEIDRILDMAAELESTHACINPETKEGMDGMRRIAALRELELFDADDVEAPTQQYERLQREGKIDDDGKHVPKDYVALDVMA